MNHISPNCPAYYLTSVTNHRLPVFRHDSLKSISCKALNEARASGNFLILAYVILPDHVHVITDGEKKAAVVLRFINGIISRRVIDYLKSARSSELIGKVETGVIGARTRILVVGSSSECSSVDE